LIVVDASVLVDIVLGTARSRELASRVFVPGRAVHCPHLLDVEIAQVLRRYALAGDLAPERGAEALRDVADLPLVRHAHDGFLPRIWQLRRNITAYDAAYVVLAESLDAPLWTRDRRLARASGHDATVVLV